uniref:hypothetical protein n=1 Tax=Bacillus velezensis TaxID=492670 RepID=UPI0016439F6F
MFDNGMRGGGSVFVRREYEGGGMGVERLVCRGYNAEFEGEEMGVEGVFEGLKVGNGLFEEWFMLESHIEKVVIRDIVCGGVKEFMVGG